MNFKKFIKENPGFEQYIRGIIRNTLELNNISNQSQKKEKEAKIDKNKKILIRSLLLDEEEIKELNSEIERIVTELSENYDPTKSFKENYTKTINSDKKVEKTQDSKDAKQGNNPDENAEKAEDSDKTEQEKNPDKNEETTEQGSKKDEEEKTTDETSGKTEQGSEKSNKDKNENNGKPTIRYVAVNRCSVGYRTTNLPGQLYNPESLYKPQWYDDYIKGTYSKSRKGKEAFLRRNLGENFKKVFNNEDKKLLKAISKCDLDLLSILVDSDVEYAKDYITQLAAGRKGSPDKLPFSLEYDFSQAKKSSKEIKRMEKIAKKSKYIAKYTRRKPSIWRKILGFGGAAVLAMGAGGALVADRNSNDQQQKPQQIPEYTDTAVPGRASTTGKETTTTTPRDTTTSSGVVTTQDPVLPIKTGDSTQYIVFDGTQNSAKRLVLGSRVTMPAGVTYTEDSLENGQSGKIGELSFRPAGDYVLDRVALWYNGELKANLGTEGTDINEAVEKLANELGVEPSEIIQKAHISLGENHVGPTGWIKADEFSMDDVKANISKTYDQIQQEKAEQQAQAQKSTQPPQQDHDDR